MTKLQFFPIDVTYKLIDDVPVIHVFGRTISNEQVLLLDDSSRPYFYVLLKKGESNEQFMQKLNRMSFEEKKAKPKILRMETAEKNFMGQDLNAIKIVVNEPAATGIIAEELEKYEEVQNVLEADIPFERRYLVDNLITPMVLCETECEETPYRAKTKTYKTNKIIPLTDVFEKPKVLAFDIETYNPLGKRVLPEEHPIIMIAFASDNFQKVITWKRFWEHQEYVEFVESEAELIEKFKEIIEQQRPDILAGYFSDGFDLPYLQARASKYKIQLDIGLDNSAIKMSKRAEFQTAAITGIAHFDVFKFVRRVIGKSLATSSYTLDLVAKEMLGEAKTEVDMDKLAEVWDNHPEQIGKYCEYNLQDSVLTLKLAQKLLPNILEFIKIIGLPLFDINRMSYSQYVEWYLIRQTKNFNQLIPNKPGYREIRERRLHTYTGAFVYEPKPGLYEDMVIYDFRSLYPTIISSHNIGPSTINCDCCAEDAEKIPVEDKEYWFCKKKRGFIPTIIEDLVKRRMRIKEMLKEEKEKKQRNIFLEARSTALKDLSNSFYGYLGFFAARWYSLESARSTTAYGRYYIMMVIEEAKKAGFDVVYSDSLPYDRHVFVKFGDGDIRLLKIGELYDKYKDVIGLSTIAFDKNKRVVFKPIVKAIRHKYQGKLLEIKTKYGSTVVTPQHSVYSFDNGIRLADAKKLKAKDKLISLTNIMAEEKYNAGFVFDIANMDLGEYTEEFALYSDNLKFPSKKGKCPYCKKEANISSHVFAKHPERREKLNKNSLFNWVGSRAGKARKIPRYWKLDKNLAWLLGLYCAEGSVSDIIAKRGRKCLLSFGSQDKKLVQKIKSILDAKTRIATKIIKDYDKRNGEYMYYYRVQCKPIVALFQYGFGCGKRSEFKKVPSFIFSAEKSLRKAFIDGYLEGDGNKLIDKRYKTHFRRFSTKSRELAEGLCFLLKTLKHGKNRWNKEIKHIAWSYRTDKPKIRTLRLQSAKESKGNFCLAEIKSVEEISHKGYVYDIEVEGAHNFVDAEGMILVHNTDSIFLALGNKTKEDSKKFAELINLKLPKLMELEFEGFYPRGIFVFAKEAEYGAKKKYALLSQDGAIKIRGFEMVRRNWSLIGKEVQENVLNIILKENDTEKALDYTKKIIAELRQNKIPLAKVIIYTQLQKDTQKYDSKGPHVAVAERMQQKGMRVAVGQIIEFVIAKAGDKIRDKARLPEEVTQQDYDPSYYIHHQIVPAVERVFNVIGYTEEDLLEEKEQSKLDKFF